MTVGSVGKRCKSGDATHCTQALSAGAVGDGNEGFAKME